jgi:hypothetical protein
MRPTSVVLQAVLAGTIATAIMDAAAVIGRKSGAVPNEDLGVSQLGRWIGYMARGKFTHERLAHAPELPNERPLGLLVHYLIGIALTGGYLALLRRNNAAPNLTTAVAYGVTTAVPSLLTVYPAYGLGWFGLRAERPGALIRTGLIGHTIFGLGVWVGTAAAGVVNRVVEGDRTVCF